MPWKDHYKILDIEFDSKPDEIKKAYHKKAQEFHPDKNKTSSASDKFKECKESYEILTDKSKREIYDLSYLREKKRMDELKYTTLTMLLNKKKNSNSASHDYDTDEYYEDEDYSSKKGTAFKNNPFNDDKYKSAGSNVNHEEINRTEPYDRHNDYKYSNKYSKTERNYRKGSGKYSKGISGWGIFFIIVAVIVAISLIANSLSNSGN